jgi:hypothetical protein
MAIVRIQETSMPGAGMETYDRVNETMNIESDPPPGLICHTASQTDDGMVIVDVWESQEAAGRFEEERLLPALREVMGGDPPEGANTVRIYDTYNVLRP